MASLARHPVSSPGDPPESEAAPSVADLAEQMRGTVTPVIGYLELISLDGHAAPTDRHLDWIATIERRLEAMRELNDQISRVCGVLRQSVTDREAAPPRAPRAPEG